MIKRIKSWLMGLAGLLAALGFLWGQHQSGKRRQAEHQRDSARRSQKATEAVQEKSNQVREKLHKAREANAQSEVTRNETPKTDRRTSRFGTADRLRDNDD